MYSQDSIKSYHNCSKELSIKVRKYSVTHQLALILQPKRAAETLQTITNMETHQMSHCMLPHQNER
jgi:hypothetical protein